MPSTEETPKKVKTKSETKPKLVADNTGVEIKTLKRDVEYLRQRVTELSRSAFFQYTKIRNVKSPERGTNQSAGIDFFIPEDFPVTDLKPNSDVLIPSGIKVKIPDGTALVFKNKSGVATKLKLIIGAEVVDSDYQGEIHLHLINSSARITRLVPGMKVAQALLLPYYNVDIIEKTTPHDLYGNITTERGSGGFGSTNKPASGKVQSTEPKDRTTNKSPGFEVWMSAYNMGGITYSAEYVGKIEAPTFKDACKLMYTKNEKLDPRFDEESCSYMRIPLYQTLAEASKYSVKLF